MQSGTDAAVTSLVHPEKKEAIDDAGIAQISGHDGMLKGAQFRQTAGQCLPAFARFGVPAIGRKLERQDRRTRRRSRWCGRGKGRSGGMG